MIRLFFDCVEEAFVKTKSLLWPVRGSVWIKLILLFFLTGGIFGSSGLHVPMLPFHFHSPSAAAAPKAPVDFQAKLSQMFSSVPHAQVQNIFQNLKTPAQQLWEKIRAVIIWIGLGFLAFLILLMLFFLWLASRFQMVLIKALVVKNVLVRLFWRETRELGERLFHLNAALFLVSLLPLFGVFSFVLWKIQTDGLQFKILWLIYAGALVLALIFFAGVHVVRSLANMILPIWMFMTGEGPLKAVKSMFQWGLKGLLLGLGALLLYLVVSVSMSVGLITILLIGLIPLLAMGGIVAVTLALIIKGAGLMLKIGVFGGLISLVLMALLALAIVPMLIFRTFLMYLRIELIGKLLLKAKPSSSN